MTLQPYVPAPVPDIIANVDDATIPIELDSDLTDDEKAAKFQRRLAIRQATAARFYAPETVERASFYELFADERTLTFGTEHGQTFAMDAAPKAAAAQEEEELAPVRLSEPEDNFAANIVDLALLAVHGRGRCCGLCLCCGGSRRRRLESVSYKEARRATTAAPTSYHHST